MTTRRRRPTRQQEAVAQALGRTGDFRSAQDLHADLRNQGDTVGLATVYRTLSTLVESGDVDVLRTDDGEARYRQCSTTHHHHLTCRHCGKAVEIDGPAVESWAAGIARQHDFVDVDHVVEVIGTCRDCHTG